MKIDGQLRQLLENRRLKLEKLRGLGIDPYPYEFQVSHSIKGLFEHFDSLRESGTEVSIAGRLQTIRRMGKATFAHLADSSGKIQLFIQKDTVGADIYGVIRLFDIGDIVGITGSLFVTRTGERSLLVKSAKLLSKNTYPLPVVKEKEGRKFDEVTDKDLRYRQRYVDLIINPEVREVFRKRSFIIQQIREYLLERDYLEVETPILQPLYGGAAARPFVTHHNALDMRLYLRIANELYLKRLIVGGFERVFEFARDFRNEGMDRFHNPEFTQLELYAAYHDYNYTMDLVEELVSGLALKLHGTTRITFGGREIDLAPKWRRVPMLTLIREETGYDLRGKSREELETVARKLDLEMKPATGSGKIIDEIFGEFVEPKLIQPTIVTDYPIVMSPLAKRHREHPDLVERFEVIIGGKELCNSFSELNDPEDQKDRLEWQHKLLERGDAEAQPFDADFIHALEIGMPPTAGLGIGIDRLVMLLLNQDSIRDVIFFPHLRPEE